MSEEAKTEWRAVYNLTEDIEMSVLGLKEYLDECRPERFDEGLKHVVRGWINRIAYETELLRRAVDGESEEGE